LHAGKINEIFYLSPPKMEFGEESCLAQFVPCACLEKDFRKKMEMVKGRQYHIVCVCVCVCVCIVCTCVLKGHAVAQLVEALCYKSEGRGFDSRWCHWNFSLT
jgi:hypothetical protein